MDQYVHYGATTVDIYDTALDLQLRRATLIFIEELRDIETTLIELARANQDAIMPGRTLGQHALPITFGNKVSTWIGENWRDIERLKSLVGELGSLGNPEGCSRNLCRSRQSGDRHRAVVCQGARPVSALSRRLAWVARRLRLIALTLALTSKL